MLKILLFVMFLYSPDCLSLPNNIFEAVKSGEVNEITSYLSAGGDPNLIDEQGNSLLLLAMIKNRLSVFEKLLAAGADPEFRNLRGDPQDRLVVMELAAVAESDEYLKLALAYGANPNTKGSYAKHGVLFQAITLSRLANVKILIANGAHINEIGPGGETPIHTAVIGRKYSIAFFLLDAGADIQIKDDMEYAPIDTIMAYGDAGIKLNSDNYQWYLKVLDRLEIDPDPIKVKRNNY